jgi:hypothetical protein
VKRRLIVVPSVSANKECVHVRSSRFCKSHGRGPLYGPAHRHARTLSPYQEDPAQVDSDLIGATSLDLNGNKARVQVTITYAIRCGTADLPATRK